MTSQETAGNLKPTQLLAVSRMGAGIPHKQIAEEIGVSAETLSRWRRQPDFAGAVNALLADLHEASRAQLRNLQSLAIETLKQALVDPKAPWPTKVSAALSVLDLTRVSESDTNEVVGPEDAVAVQLDRDMKASGRANRIMSGR